MKYQFFTHDLSVTAMTFRPFRPGYKVITGLVLSQLSKPVRLVPPASSDADEGDQPDGTYNVRVLEPDANRGHIALGRFMDEWSAVEMELAKLLELLLGVDRNVMPALLNNLGVRGQVETISTLCVTTLDDNARARLLSSLERVKSANTRRNHIVHGHWMLEVVLNDYGGRIKHKTIAYRTYDPSNPDTIGKLRDPKNKAERNKYMFSVIRINQLTEELQNLSLELSAIENSLTNRT